LFTPERVVAALGPDQWRIAVADAPTRAWAREEGTVTVTDTVVLATRR
jgi:hypothetical protein